MTSQINYASLAGAYKGTMQLLSYSLVSSKIVDMDKYDELKIFIAKEIERIESTHGEKITTP